MNYITAFDLIIANKNKGDHNIAIGYAAHNKCGTPITRYVSFYVPAEVAESVAEVYLGMAPFLIEAIVKEWKSLNRPVSDKTFAFGVAEEGDTTTSTPFKIALTGGYIVVPITRFNQRSTGTTRKDYTRHTLITKA